MWIEIFKEKYPKPLVVLFFVPIIYSILIPFAITLWVANESIRCIVALLLWLKYGPGLRLTNDRHVAMFNNQSMGNSRNVLVVGITEKTTVDLSKFAKNFETRVLFHEEITKASKYFSETKTYRPYAKLEKIMVSFLGYACWKNDVHFDIKNHFRIAEDEVYDENNLMELLSSLSKDMNEEKPQWEWIFIPRYLDANGNEKTIQIFRYHHAYMDELALQFMLSAQLGSESIRLPFNPKETQPENWKKIILYINTLVYGPFVLLMMILQKFSHHWIPSPASYSSPRQNFVTSSAISIKVFERIRAQTNASITNTVTKAFIASMRNVLPNDRLLEKVRICETIAVLPFLNSNPQNRYSVFAYDIATNEVQETPQEFCDSVAKLRRDRLGEMASPQQLLFFYILSYLFTLPPVLLKYIADGVYSSVMMRNIPSFTEKVSFFDTEVEELSIYPPLNSRAGISLANTSYDGGIKLTLIANSSWLTQEDLQRIIIAMPKVIYAIEEKGYIPSELPESSARKLITNPLRHHVNETENEVSSLESSASSIDSSFDENDPSSGKKLLEGKNQENENTPILCSILDQSDTKTLDSKPDKNNHANYLQATENLEDSLKTIDKINNVENGSNAPSSIPLRNTSNSTPTTTTNGSSNKRRTETTKNNKTAKARSKNGKR